MNKNTYLYAQMIDHRPVNVADAFPYELQLNEIRKPANEA